MASLIESLVAAPIKRQDRTRLAITTRPVPLRTRDLFEVFGGLGTTASLPAVRRSINLRVVDSRSMTHVVLGRWPTNAELAKLPDPYAPWQHLESMLLSEEFRALLPRRVCDAFPEKRRLLHVRIPSCAGRFVNAVLGAAHPIVRYDCGSAAFADPGVLAPYLGQLFARFNTAAALAISSDRLAPFIDPPAYHTDGADPLGWAYLPPPGRPIDLIFAVVRSPLSLALSQVNATLTVLRRPDGAYMLPELVEKLGGVPPPNRHPAWKRLAHTLLRDHLPANPLCHALGDGTADSALAACARLPTQLVDIQHTQEWCRSAFNAPPDSPVGVSERFLSESDLSREDRAVIEDRMGQDQVIWAKVSARIAATGLLSAFGHEL
jgi:hypothetical protein